ncbi:MAG TPA: hypothetical protein P5513_06865 [Candidatus Diapherotrites archaeon]|nr:hypothetical protein [Candidatus Diapherotrites archaeon]
MHRAQRLIFNNFGVFSQEGGISISNEEENYRYNILVLEIVTNWDFINNMMEKIYSGVLKNVDTVEREWLNFIIFNSINIKDYKDSDSFMNNFLKKQNL